MPFLLFLPQFSSANFLVSVSLCRAEPTRIWSDAKLVMLLLEMLPGPFGCCCNTTASSDCHRHCPHLCSLLLFICFSIQLCVGDSAEWTVAPTANSDANSEVRFVSLVILEFSVLAPVDFDHHHPRLLLQHHHGSKDL